MGGLVNKNGQYGKVKEQQRIFWKVKHSGEAMTCMYGPTKIHKEGAPLDPSAAARTLSHAKLPNI